MRDCPDRGELRRLLSGQHPPDREQALERHLENCEPCRRLLESLTDVRDVVPDQPVPARDRLLESPALKRVMEQFQANPDPLPACCGQEARPPFLRPTDRPGFLGKLGPYEIRRVVGRGGTGMVFEGFDPVLKRTVAVKVLSPLLAVSDQARSRFLREAQAAAALTHEHIVTLHAVDQADGVPFLVLQYVSGESLADRLRRDGRLPVADVVRIGLQVARGLAAAHAQGLVHRDIKPGNILLEEGTDRALIADFGLVKTAGEEALTLEGTIAGTPEFMSPEQASGAAVDARSDLFSLGVVLYMACTGTSPFRGESPLLTLERVCRGSPAPLGQVDPSLPDWFCQIVHRLLEKDPRRRIPSAAELVEALQRQEAVRCRRGWKRSVAALLVAAALAGAAGAYLGRLDISAREPDRPPQIGFKIAGQTETFGQLGEALQAASDGDVIEVYGDGPFPTPPLQTEGKRLTIRAAGSSKPLFLPEAPGRRGTQPFVTADADLRLEGLELRWTLAPSPGESESELLSRCAVVSTRGHLSLTHCRIMAGRRNGCVGSSGQQLVLHRCHLVASAGECVFWRPATGGRLSAEGCVLEGPIAVSVFAASGPPHSGPAQLSLAQNTVMAEKALYVRADPRPTPPLRMTAHHNILDSSQLMLLRSLRPLRRVDKGPTELRRFLRSFIHWSEEANVYRRGMAFVVGAPGPRAPVTLSAGVEDLGQWLRLWDLPEKQSVERAPRVRLTGVGADASLLGPGPAYHAWRASPGYRPWLSASEPR